MSEKKTFEDKPELPLSEGNEVLRPPPRRKKSMKKTKIEAEKARQKQLDGSAVDSKNNDELAVNSKSQTNQELMSIASEDVKSTKETLQQQTQNNNNQLVDSSECEKQSSSESQSTNEMQINDSKAEEQPEFSKENKMTTNEHSLSINEERNTCTVHFESDNQECIHHDMGNKNTSSPKSNLQNSKSKESQTCSNQGQGNYSSSAGDEGKKPSDDNELESFCWVANVAYNPSSSVCDEEMSKQDIGLRVETSINVAKEGDAAEEMSKQTTATQKGEISSNCKVESSGMLNEAAVSNSELKTTSPLPEANSQVCEVIYQQSESGKTNGISSEAVTSTINTDPATLPSYVVSNMGVGKEISTQLDQRDSIENQNELKTITSESVTKSADSNSSASLSSKNKFDDGDIQSDTKDYEILVKPIIPCANQEERLSRASNMKENDGLHSTVTGISCQPALEDKSTLLSENVEDQVEDQDKSNIQETISTNLNGQDSEQNTNNEIDDKSSEMENITEIETKTKPRNSSSSKGKDPRKGSIPYEHLGDSLSSVEEYKLWEDENISSDSDSDIFYSDDYSSSEGEGEYNIEQNERLCGTHNIDGDQGNSLPRSPTTTINEILAVFPNTEYLSVAEGKDTINEGNHGNSSHSDNTPMVTNSNDLELSEDRADSLKRKIGSFKVVKKVDQNVDTDVVKEAAVAMPTDSYTEAQHTSAVGTNAEEAEKAIQALHKSYLKHVSRDSKTKPKKSTETEGESAVYFSRVSTVQQDGGCSKMDKNLEISRPRSIHGEPRVRSLSTGDLRERQSGIIKDKQYTLPLRTRSWRLENDDRLINLGGELRYIIGSLGQLEISRDREVNGSPLMKNARTTGPGLEMVSEVGSTEAVDSARNNTEPCQIEESTADVFEETTTTLTEFSMQDSTLSYLESSDSCLGSPIVARPLSVVPEESSTTTSSNRTSAASIEDKPQLKDIEGDVPDGATPIEQVSGNLIDELGKKKPLHESTPNRPKSLEISSNIALDESSFNISQKEEAKPKSDGNSKSAGKNNGKNGDVETRKIKMTSGRRPFSAVEPGNIPTSPTEAFVKLRGFRSTSDHPDAGIPYTEVGVEAIEEETTPQRPPRKKPLTPSSSFTLPSREKPVKRVKNGKNRPDRSFRQTLTDADWLKVRLSMVKPSIELMHDGPVTLVTDALPASIPNFPTHKRAQIALELYTTERTYVRGLETIIELFKTPLEGYLDSKEMEIMFSNVNSIFALNKDVLFSLCERVTHWTDDQMFGDIFVEMAPRFKIYAAYCTNYDAAENLIKQKIKRKKDFEAFLNTCYMDPVCQPGLTLQAYLITVVQRIPRYLLLLRDLAKCTSSDHVDSKSIKEGIQKMNNIAEFINNQLQTVQGQKAMTEIRSRVIGIKAFETPGRSLIKEGEVYLMSTKKTYKCLLFNDMIVFAAKNVNNKHGEVEMTLELKTLWVCDLDENDPQTTKEDAIELYTPERSYTMYAGSRNEKKYWLQKLKTAIAIQLHGEEATESSEISSRKAAFTFKDGRIYCGCFVDSKTHGHGVLAWPNRTRYVGNFEDGERNGIGELTYNTGEKYKGEWLDDKQHGVGTLTYPNGDVYCGEWKEGKMHGKGLITFNNNDKIDGEFADSEVCGWAKLECTNNLVYEGSWKHSKKHGKGKLTKPNGDTYEGEFLNDRIHGQGTMVYAKTKATYNGQWENNQRHGIGSFSIPNGAHYEGEWSSDHIQGRGKMEYGNGEVYEGSWFRDMRFGKGLFKSHEGVYEGHFEYNLRHKYGLMDYNDGSKYDGEWQNDQREGQGEMVYPDLGIYEGNWFHNLRHGRGKMTYPNGATYEGNWDLDSPHGSDGVYIDEHSNYVYKGDWVHGRKEGRGTEKAANGTYEGDFKANVRHGKGVETLKGGIVFEGKWRDNRKVGEGQRRTRWGSTETTEIQQWKEGQLLNKDESVAPDLPFLQRR